MAHAHVIGPFPPGADPEEYDRRRRDVLWRIVNGLYLLGSLDGEQRNLMTCNWVTQISVEPKLVAASIEKGVHTYDLVQRGGVFTISFLDRADRAIVRKFVKPAPDDRPNKLLNGISYRDAPVSGAPIVGVAVAYLDCSVRNEVDCGSHVLFIGEVVDAGYGAVDGPAFEALELLRMEDTRMSYGG